VQSIVVSGTIKELANTTVNLHSHFLLKSLVCLQWDTVEPRAFPWLELVDGLVDFFKHDWVVDLHQLLSLRDQVKKVKFDWLVITEYSFKVRSKDSHVLDAVGCKRSIREAHGHIH
jgi:hypothetical protein